MRVYKKKHPDGRIELLIYIEPGERRGLAIGLIRTTVLIQTNGLRDKLRNTLSFLNTILRTLEP